MTRGQSISKYHQCANAITKKRQAAMPRPCSKKAKLRMARKQARGITGRKAVRSSPRNKK